MLIKYEARSKRVKGIAFHPKRPWILTSLHTGAINMYDYRMGTLLDTFAEHDGPVRGIHFHPALPLFVSGGDDNKIRVWNYKLKRCLYTLTGHLDYIRTVQFHHEQPWIISCSDDQTIRIWNWQSRSCISVLTGHNHYVMSAFFHPRDDYIVSSSLDQTVRIWDMSGLKKKSPQVDDKVSQLNQDLFGSNDVMVKYILEGHERGVNWAYFHPTLQMVCSGGDDKVVRMWRYNESRAWEMDTYRGHVSNVSCCMFHPKLDLLLANSEDRSIRVWDYNKNNLVYNYKRENDRFWVLATHPTQNLVAAGHDNGLMIFKFERERPAYFASKNTLIYIKEKYVKKYDLDKNSESTVGIIKKSGPKPVKTLAVSEGEILITSDNESGEYELLRLSSKKEDATEFCSVIKKNSAIGAVISGRKLAYLDKNRNIQIDNPKTGIFKQVVPSSLGITSSVDQIFTATPGRVLLKTEDKVYMYDFEQNSIIAEISTPGVKYVVWSEDMQKVALLSKFNITLANNKLVQLCSVHEIIRVKSGAFDENGVFIYTTHNHMKYCIPTGDFGTIKTLESPIYLIRVKSNAVHYLDREGSITLTYIDATEYRFKLALLDGNTRQVKQIMGKSKILGESIISYMQQKGHPEIALKFVQDDVVKFNLALECGNIKTAFALAHKIKNKDCWTKLAHEALEQGDFETVEKAYQRINSYEKLSFLYLINGDTKSLTMMQNVAELRKDPLSKFQNALFLGDVETRIKVLQEVGQYGLAYATAKTHGLEKKASELEALLGESVPKDIPSQGTLLLPPTPVYKPLNFSWPLLTKQEEVEFEEEEEPTQREVVDLPLENKWGESINMTDDTLDEPKQITEENGEPSFGGGWGESLEVPMDQKELLKSTSSEVVAGKSPIENWLDSDYAVDHIAGGSFRTAMDILTKNAGIVNFEPLKQSFMNIFMGSQPILPCYLGSISYPLQREGIPIIATPSLEELTNKLKTIAFKEMTEGKFSDAQNTFLSILHSIVFLVTTNKKELSEIRELTKICVEYLSALRLESTRKESKDQKRTVELVAYFTHCKLNQAHLMLSLQTAMSLHFKAENFVSAAGLAKRLKKLSPPPQLSQQADYVLKNAEQKNTNKFSPLVYDEKNPFVLCCQSLTPIYTGSDSIVCSFCNASYLPQHKDSTCVICNIATVGKSVSGLNHLRKK